MSLYNYTRQRYDVLTSAPASSNYGNPILAADFKTILVDLDQAELDGELAVFVSDDYDAPDVSASFGPDNEFYEVAYSDTRNGVEYNGSNRYNPSSSTPGGNAQFNVQTTGARWVIACILNKVSGELIKLSVNLYDNQ